MNDESKKKKRPTGRLPQLNKRSRLTRRHQGRWHAQAPQAKRNASTFSNLTYTSV